MNNTLKFNGSSDPYMNLNVPILGQQAQVWRCAEGHEYTGGIPKMVLPLNPMAPIGPNNALAIVAEGMCLTCVLNWVAAQFPVGLVTPATTTQHSYPYPTELPQVPENEPEDADADDEEDTEEDEDAEE